MDNSFFSTFYLTNKHCELFLSDPEIAFIQYKKFRLNLISGERTEAGVDQFFYDLKRIKMADRFEDPLVLHLFYELGYSCMELKSKLDEHTPLAIVIRYQQAQERKLIPSEVKNLNFESLSKVSLEKYHTQFDQVYRNLLDGETYQLNLTQPFYLRANKRLEPHQYIAKLWGNALKVGAYAHATYIDSLDKLFLSNSPECLFQIKEHQEKLTISTMPIKGTEKIKNDDWKTAWDKLCASQKNQSELYMITDLMRNDLSRLTGKPARVTFKKYPLSVPGLVHQFSVIESELSRRTHLSDVVRCLFPGGSITGAPKKRTMELIAEIENYRRGFYCGSTLLLYREIKTASINIRSAEIDYSQNEVKYGAGGGITLQSQAQEEFEETLDKLKSFLLLVK